MVAEVRSLDARKLPSPYREVLQREVEKLKKNDDVLAIGLAGSVARGDLWQGSDLDIEVILKGDKPKNVVCTEQEISVDYGYFGEAYIPNLPHDTVPIYDPTGTLTRGLKARSKKELWKKMILSSTAPAAKYILKARVSLAGDPYSALCLIHVAATELGSALILATGMVPSARRTISKLEQATKKICRQDLFNKYLSLFGMPSTIEKADYLLKQLKEGYREVWPYFKGKTIGPKYMIQQPDSESWFRNRIKPIYEYDKRDLVWIAFIEYSFVLEYVLKNIGKDDFPENVFTELRSITGPAALWIGRYRDILRLISKNAIPNFIPQVEELLEAIRTVAGPTYLT